MKLGNAIFTMGTYAVKQVGDNVEISFGKQTYVLEPFVFMWLLHSLNLISQLKDVDE